ncbi:hypothetical protein CVT24_013020 [Panaeolus cyanescens]|uniref:Uncharacterized protein n=1 Tax=Panaeolus cyanescens TaxID=181874 RepID=A0A409WDK9_9AGAR|nr:hypothetical protein CVT24_013020 [Panaeolus cyanescens]
MDTLAKPTANSNQQLIVDSPPHPTPHLVDEDPLGTHSFRNSLASLSKNIRHSADAFYLTERALATPLLGEPRKARRKTNPAIDHVQNAKVLFAQRAEHLRKLFQNCYNHAVDYVLLHQSPPCPERDELLNDCLRSAKNRQQDFSKFLEEYKDILAQFELQKPILLQPISQADPSPKGTAPERKEATEEIVGKLFSSLNLIPVNCADIVKFWARQVQLLSKESEVGELRDVLLNGTDLDLMVVETCSSSLSPITQEIHNQAVQYAKAIDLSVVAAQRGFTVADDAISLLDMMKVMQTTIEERREYLEGTMELARKGRTNAFEARNKFVDVRNVIEGLARQLLEDDRNKVVSVSKPLKELTSELLAGIQHLEELRDSLTQFVQWWNLIDMETKTQIDRQQKMAEHLSKMHMQAIYSRWVNHRGRYSSYVLEISLIQDYHPELFAKSRKIIGKPNAIPIAVSYSPLISDPPPFTSKDAKGVPIDNPLRPPLSVNPPASGRPGRRESDVIISEEFNSTSSYLSAKLKHVQVLEPGHRAFLMLHFQCHPGIGHRCRSINIKWKFRSDSKASDSPRVIDVAPKQSVGAHTEEAYTRNLALSAPAQVNVGGATFGPELSGHWERSKIVSRAMIITGSVRGIWSDSAEWTLVENSGAKAGVPSHFCVGVIVSYDGPFKMELILDAKHVASAKWWKSHIQAKNEVPLDIDMRAADFEPYADSANWKQWFYSINGEIDGTTNVHSQRAFTA